MKITLHPWRRASEPVPIELFGEPLLIEDFLGNYVVGHYSCFRWWVKAYDGEDKIFREENVKKWIPIGSFYSSNAKPKNRI